MLGAEEARTLRVATFSAGLARRGPGLLLRDLQGGRDAQALAAARVVAAARPDVLLLTDIDWDHGQAALAAFAALVAAEGLALPHRFALRPNRGMATGLDLDGDGRRGTPDDAQGWAPFAGAKGMAVLSALPLAAEAARDFSAFLWRDLPGALLAGPDGAAPSEPVLAVQRLATTAAWDVPVALPGGGRLHLLAFHAGPPVFGPPDGRNRRRNHDEVTFWRLLLDGALPVPPPAGPFVLLGTANLDPEDGAGMRAAIAALLAHPALQDPRPASPGGAAAGARGRNAAHRGDPARDTAQWDGPRQPGNLRVDYVLPAAGLRVVGAGVLWPAPGEALAETVAAASRHRLVWVDIAF